MKIALACTLLCTTLFLTTDELVDQAYELIQQKEYHAACSLYHRIITAHPHNMLYCYHYAYLLKQTGNMDLAARYYAHVLADQPEHRHAHVDYAQVLLALGDFTHGYHEFEWRHPDNRKEIEHAKKIIAQRTHLNGLIFLLRAEWGMGDAIQMLRYARELKQRGATVHVALLHKTLEPLMRMQPYIDHIIAPGDAIEPHHFAIPMMSLPYVFGTTPDTIPFPHGYLTIDSHHLERWKPFKQSHRTTYNVGICWHGNTIHNPSKFMPLHFFVELAQMPSVRLFSVQKVDGLEQIDDQFSPAPITIFDASFDVQHGAFVDTAAVLHCLDVVITVDTSIAHLAGALGIPTWLVLPVSADWRWMLERTDSPWYTSMRLFRQQEPNNWKTVAHELTHALCTLCTHQNVQH